MESQSPLKILLDSRTYVIYNFRSCNYESLYQSIAKFIDDEDPTFELLVPFGNNWIHIKDDISLTTYVLRAVCPLIYVNELGNYYIGTPSILRAQTYNITKFDDDPEWEKRKHMIVQQIKKTNPDVLCLQDIKNDPNFGRCLFERTFRWLTESLLFDKPKGRNMLKEILDSMPEYPYYYWHDSMVYKDGTIEGIAIISRYPISDVTSIKLSRSCEDSVDRYCVRALISHPKKAFEVFNVQLTTDNKRQVMQASEILGFMDKSDKGRNPQILLGDFKIKEKYQVPGDVLEGKYHIKQQCTLKDAWKTTGSDGSGFTFPSWSPNNRFDRIYYRNLEEPPNFEVVGKALSKKTWASSHCSVYADFILSLC